jgi:hypothetical protein
VDRSERRRHQAGEDLGVFGDLFGDTHPLRARVVAAEEGRVAVARERLARGDLPGGHDQARDRERGR